MNNRDTCSSPSPEVYKLEASAGSGKTYALAKRYIKLLVNPDLKPQEAPLNSILAITFTNKAATEMKERILESLKKIALDGFASPKEREDMLSYLCVGRKAAGEKAHFVMDSLMRNFNFFQVQTIDSFVNTVLSGCAFKLNLSAAFKTEEDYGRYLAYSLDKLIDQACQDEAVMKMFRDFLRRYLFIEARTGWFPKQNMLSIMEGLFSKSNKYQGRFIHDETGSGELILRRRRILGLMARLKEGLPAQTNALFSKSLASFIEQSGGNFNLDRVPDFFKRKDFPVNKDGRVGPEKKKLWGQIRRGLSALCQAESDSAFNCYIDIFNRLLLDLKDISSREDVLFLEALNKQARSLFGEKLLDLPELYWRLACRFRHFLIDEFQDTSLLQWENLFPMVEEALSTGGSLFYVGDRKQAIYRFRGGEISLMDSGKERLGAYNLTEGSLTVNYRSRKEIVEFNNNVFSQENLKRFLCRAQQAKRSAMEFSAGEIEAVCRVFEGSRQVCRQDKPGGYVKLELVEQQAGLETGDSLRQGVLGLIGDLTSRFWRKDIAILARRNEEVQLLSSWLLEEGIACESEKTLDIKQNSYIKELVSFLKFLNSPIDNLSFASFILGDIFLKASGLAAGAIQDFIFRFQHKDGKEAGYLYREFRQQFSVAWDGLIEEPFKAVGFVPLYELTVSILSKFDVVKEFYEYQGFFMRLLELIKEQEEERASISSFLEFFEQAPAEDLYVKAIDSDSVKILTIHKSKGLQFKAVILPFLEMNVRVDSEIVVPRGQDSRLIHLKRRYADFSQRLAGIYRQEYLKSFIDELNSVYVAFTRASDELYVFVSPKGQAGLNLASELLPKERLEFGSRAGSMEDRGAAAHFESADLPFSRYKDWIHILKDEFIDPDALRNRQGILKGNILHCILSFIGNLYRKDEEEALAEAIARARIGFPLIRDFSGYEQSVRRMLSSRDLAPYFKAPDASVYTEKEVVDSSGSTRRIDRLIIKEGRAWVIDYKSTREDREGHLIQVREYADIIRKVFPALEVKGVLIYLDDLGKEEISG